MPKVTRPAHAPTPAPRGWQRPLEKSLQPKASKQKPWLRLLNDADQVEGFEYHNPRLSIFYPQEGL